MLAGVSILSDAGTTVWFSVLFQGSPGGGVSSSSATQTLCVHLLGIEISSTFVRVSGFVFVLSLGVVNPWFCKPWILRVARLQNGVGTKDFFEARFFSRKSSEIFPEMFVPLFCGSEKIPQSSRQISH